MNKLKFDKAFEELTHRQKEVLQEMLSGKTDKAIAESKKITEVSVRKHVQRICKTFELKNFPGQQYSQRPVLINLFAKYKPKLVNCELLNLEVENKEQQSLTPPVIVDSAFYVERPPIETYCYEEIAKPGSLLRIKAPQHMGKTSLMDRIVQYSKGLGYETETLSFKLADSNIFADLDKFSKWFCAVVSNKLRLPNKLDNYWDDLFGCNYNTTIYLQDYLLAEINSPLVLALDDVDLVFEHPAIASDFCVLLRGWHEQARRGNRDSGTWQKLRLIIVHATDIYSSMDINSSPLANVGKIVELPELNPQQVKDLAHRHKLDWNDAQVNKLMNLVGGHPYLVQLALDRIKYSNITLEQLLQEAPTEAGIYSNYLRQHLGEFEENPKLAGAFQEVVLKGDWVQLDPVQAFKLHSMGIVKLKGNSVKPSCELYHSYFKVHLRN